MDDPERADRARTTDARHVERFAPSPTGRLHLGHAFSAMLAHDRARAAGGRFLLRMEDLDAGRVRPDYARGIEEDLHWLGLDWDGPVLFQSTRTDAYDSALARLAEAGLTYACTCTRRDIAEAARAPQDGAADGSDAARPCSCRKTGRAGGGPRAVRLDLAAALARLGGAEAAAGLAHTETGTGAPASDARASLAQTGDIVLRRRDGATAYHLAVVIDDAFQKVTHVTRGEDLAASVPIQRVLQALLGLPAPEYHHHGLIRDATGKRLAKRHDALALATLRAEGVAPEQIRARFRAAPPSGAPARDGPARNGPDRFAGLPSLENRGIEVPGPERERP